jgi:hypothetical protein
MAGTRRQCSYSSSLVLFIRHPTMLLFLLSVLVFVCPETAPVRLKMIYSTAKATLKTIAEQMGIIFDKVVSLTWAGFEYIFRYLSIAIFPSLGCVCVVRLKFAAQMRPMRCWMRKLGAPGR